MEWALEVEGVGNCRVVPLWSGNGTVKVIIANANKEGADATLIANTLEHIEELRPVGATVTVVSCVELPINITATFSIDVDNYTIAEVIANIETNIKEYLETLAFKVDYVSYAKVASITLNSLGVNDYTNLKINGGTINIPVDIDEVAILGGVVNNA
jgi:uncharacterized phage protein gp47/JayE